MIPGQGTFRFRRHWFFGRSNDLDSRTSNLGGDVQILTCTVYIIIIIIGYAHILCDVRKRRTLCSCGHTTPKPATITTKCKNARIRLPNRWMHLPHSRCRLSGSSQSPLDSQQRAHVARCVEAEASQDRQTPDSQGVLRRSVERH